VGKLDENVKLTNGAQSASLSARSAVLRYMPCWLFLARQSMKRDGCETFARLRFVHHGAHGLSRGNDHEEQCLAAVDYVIPFVAIAIEHLREDADAGVEHEAPQHAGDSWRHGIRPHQEGFVGACAADDSVGHHR
jgi:hypothetical protein